MSMGRGVKRLKQSVSRSERLIGSYFAVVLVIFTHYSLARLWVASQSFVFLLYAVMKHEIVCNLEQVVRDVYKSTTEVQGISPD